MPTLPILFCGKCRQVMPPAPDPVIIHEQPQIMTPSARPMKKSACDVYRCAKCGQFVLVAAESLPYRFLGQIISALRAHWQKAAEKNNDPPNISGDHC